jgi:hypothetical protein
VLAIVTVRGDDDHCTVMKEDAQNDESGEDNSGDHHAKVRITHANIIETIFNPLPEGKGSLRKKEQDSRRKYKEKLIAKYPGCLIVDSIGHTIDDKEAVQYTNTIFVTDSLDWWRQHVSKLYKDKYTREQKDLTSGDQVTWRDKNGDKYLTFSFYPSKQKMMVQGNHNDLETWIENFRSLAQVHDKNRVSDSTPKVSSVAEPQGKDHSATDETVEVAEENLGPLPGNDSGNQESASAPQVSNVTEARSGDQGEAAVEVTEGATVANEGSDEEVSHGDNATESVLFYTPKATGGLFTGNNESTLFASPTPHINKTYKARRQGSFGKINIMKSATNCRDSQRLVQIKSRLDSLEGIMTGLQGGLVQVVESLQSHRVKTDEALAKLMDITQQILAGKMSNNKSTNAKEINQVKESVCQLQNTVNKKLSCITEQVKSVETSLQRSSEARKRTNQELRECIYDENEKMQSNIASDIESRMGILNNQIDKLKDSMDKVTRVNTQRPEKSARVPQVGLSSAATRRVYDTSPQSASSRAEMSSSRRVSSHETLARTSRERSPTRTEVEVGGERSVLLVGDSTTKYLDKRRILRDQTISKSRAATIPDALSKMNTENSRAKEKVVLCVGLNDIRDGNSAQQVAEEMEKLIKETQKRHPRCKVYICSILPVNIGELKETIKQTNSYFEQLSRRMNNVYYVNTLREFTSHTSLQALFERDQIHPNTKGSMVMTLCIRSSLQHDHTPRNFDSHRTDTANKTYADCVRPGLSQSARDDRINTTRRREVDPNPPSTGHYEPAPGQYAYQPRPFPSNVWWPPGYPPMMPFCPPAYQHPARAYTPGYTRY